MNYNYIFIDEAFISRLEDNKRERFKDYLYQFYLNCISKKTRKLDKETYFKNLRRVKYKIMCSYCTYCKKLYILGLKNDLEGIKGAKFCVSCGETNIYVKAEFGLKKINNLIDIYYKLDEEVDKELIHDLNQQILVLIATKMEVLFRDYYKTFLNMKIVKSGLSEVERFEKDCKNDFINIDKTIDRFKRELGINLKSIIGTDRYKDMKEISAYRNVIVHNNGLCDNKFLSYGIGTYSERDSIEIKIDDINRYLKTTTEIIIEIGKIYEETYMNEVVKEIEDMLDKQLII